MTWEKFEIAHPDLGQGYEACLDLDGYKVWFKYKSLLFSYKYTSQRKAL